MPSEGQPKTDYSMARLPAAAEVLSRPGVWNRVRDVLVDDSIAGVLLTDADGRILYANRTFCKLVGRNQTELLHFTWMDLTPAGPGRDFEEDERGKLVDGSQKEAEYDKVYYHADGSVITAAIHITRVVTDDGSFACIVGQVIDKTPRRRSGDNKETGMASGVQSVVPATIVEGIGEMKIRSVVADPWVKWIVGIVIAVATGSYGLQYVKVSDVQTNSSEAAIQSKQNAEDMKEIKRQMKLLLEKEKK